MMLYKSSSKYLVGAKIITKVPIQASKISFNPVKTKVVLARNLRYMQKFATEIDNYEFLQHHVKKLPWSSITTIID